MNPYKTLLLIKKEDKTLEVSTCKYINGKYHVLFNNRTNPYEYGYNSIEWLKNPSEISITDHQFFASKTKLYNLLKVLQFNDYIRIFFESGFSKVYHVREIRIVKSCLEDKKSSDIMSYFIELSKYISLRTDEGLSIMENKYRKLSFISNELVLATYLNPQFNKIKTYPEKKLIFPYGCNMSQKEAVRNAMTQSISVIEGPPGTGKTQTILNIIANILMEEKTVAVVSNNNSATRNVLEKLQTSGVDFVAAYLGNTDNKKNFIENQQLELPLMKSVEQIDLINLQGYADELHKQIESVLKLKNDIALLKQKIDAIVLEMKHFENYYEETVDDKNRYIFKNKLPSKNIMKLWIKYEAYNDQSIKKELSFFQKLMGVLIYRISNFDFFDQPIERILLMLQRLYYKALHQELTREVESGLVQLSNFNYEEKLAELTEVSMNVLKGKLAYRYKGKTRQHFSFEDLYKNSNSMLKEYPVILSTTYSVCSSLSNDTIYDYVIVDEASQVDLLTGVLAMSCAKNIVIVGDRMQLPNVITEADQKLAEKVSNRFEIPSDYHYEEHSLLTSVIYTIDQVPKILLKEHYRCHPKIIQFCNQKFYHNQLVIMTEDKGEEDVLKAYKTVQGNHARGHNNQRQIDEIKERVLPEISVTLDHNEVGIISPYRDQKQHLQKILLGTDIDIDTVHKFQGREKDYIIITTVDNEITDFTDNANLLNVAISRAKKKIRIVLSDHESNENTNIGEFIRYIQYNNCEIVEGNIYSVFDLLYKAYSHQRKEMLKKSKKISEYDSENIIYALLVDILKEDAYSGLDVLMHQPLNMLIRNPEKLTEEEVKYLMNTATHTDFLLYRKIDKTPVLVIEVDGYKYHKEGTRQHERDQLKDSIFEKYKVPYLRLLTTGSGERERVIIKLKDVL